MKTPELYRDVVKRFKTLSNDAELKLVEDNRDDVVKLRDLLFYHNIKYALSIASEYDCLGNVHGGEDCLQNAILGLYKASRNFDISAGTKFTTYATYYIRREILYFTRLTENNVSQNAISINRKVSSKDNEDIREISDVIQRYVEPTLSIGVEKNFDDYENIKSMIRNALNSDLSLSQRHREMFSTYYLSNERPSIEYMMNRFRISRRRVTQILKEAKDSVIDRLARMFPEDVFVKHGIDSVLEERDKQFSEKIKCESPSTTRYSHVNYEKLSVKRSARKTRTIIRWRPDYLNDKIYHSKSNLKQTSLVENDLNDATDMIESHIQNSGCGIVFDEEAHFVD